MAASLVKAGAGAGEMARVHIDNSRYDSECTPSYYNNEGKLDDLRPTIPG